MTGNDGGEWRVDPGSGEVRVGGRLSLEFPESLLVLKVADAGSPPRSDTATLRILIGAGDESPPRWERELYALDVAEATPPGAHLLAVFAHSPGGIAYSIPVRSLPFSEERPVMVLGWVEAAEGDAHFAVHPVSGLVTLTRGLDAETRPLVNFTVQAK